MCDTATLTTVVPREAHAAVRHQIVAEAVAASARHSAIAADGAARVAMAETEARDIRIAAAAGRPPQTPDVDTAEALWAVVAPVIGPFSTDTQTAARAAVELLASAAGVPGSPQCNGDVGFGAEHLKLLSRKVKSNWTLVASTVLSAPDDRRELRDADGTVAEKRKDLGAAFRRLSAGVSLDDALGEDGVYPAPDAGRLGQRVTAPRDPRLATTRPALFALAMGDFGDGAPEAYACPEGEPQPVGSVFRRAGLQDFDLLPSDAADQAAAAAAAVVGPLGDGPDDDANAGTEPEARVSACGDSARPSAKHSREHSADGDADAPDARRPPLTEGPAIEALGGDTSTAAAPAAAPAVIDPAAVNGHSSAAAVPAPQTEAVSFDFNDTTTRLQLLKAETAAARRALEWRADRLRTLQRQLNEETKELFEVAAAACVTEARADATAVMHEEVAHSRRLACQLLAVACCVAAMSPGLLWNPGV